LTTKAEAEAVEFMRLDKETGELCIGDACFMVRINPETNEVVLEMDPNSEVCDVRTRKLAKTVMENIMKRDKGVKTKVRIKAV